MSQYITRVELAEAMGLSTETIRRLTAARKIPFYRIGRSYRYELAAVLQTFASQADHSQVLDQKTAMLG
ncbi:Helix-turn-helix domain protein [compost metagenome]